MAKQTWGDDVLLEILVKGDIGKRTKTHKLILDWFQEQNYAEASLHVDTKRRKITLRGNPQASTAAHTIALVKAHAEAYNATSIGAEYSVQQAMPKDGANHDNRMGLTRRIDHLQGENERLHTENTALSQEKSELFNENAANQEHIKRLDSFLETDRAKLKELVERQKATKVVEIGARKDGSVPLEELCIEYMKFSFVRRVRLISEAYSKVLEKLDMTPHDFKVAARIASRPLEESPEYAKAVCEKEKAEKGKRDAEKFNAEHEDWKAGTELSDKKIEEKITGEARLRKAYPLYQRIVRYMRSALGENTIQLIVTSKKTDTSTNINVVLPVEYGKDSYGELEKDMIGYVKEMLAYFMRRKLGRYRTTERNGLIQFTFATRSENPDELANEIINGLFKEQRKRHFPKIGCGLNITVIADTTDWTLEDAMAAERQDKPGFKTKGVPETYVQLAVRAMKDGINLPNPRGFIKVMKEKPLQRYAAIMMACAGGYRTPAEIHQMAGEILEQTPLQVEMPSMPALWNYLDRLFQSGMLVAGEERRGRTYTYTISEKLMEKPDSNLEETVAEADTGTAPSNNLGFRKKGVPKTYVRLARQARQEGFKLPNPRKFTKMMRIEPMEKYAAIMMACAGEDYHTSSEIDEKAREILRRAGLSAEIPNIWGYIGRLRESRVIIEGEKRGKSHTYRLASKFRNKPMPKE